MRPNFLRRSTRLGDVGSPANWGFTARECRGLEPDDLNRSNAVDGLVGRFCGAGILLMVGFFAGLYLQG
jgi:hypothetical protein